jgi:hypothetical protein
VVKKPFDHENHQSPKKKMQKNEKTKSRVGSVVEPTVFFLILDMHARAAALSKAKGG